MASLIELLSKWPLVRQIRERKDGTALSRCRTRRARCTRVSMTAKVARSICPYCGVGCGQLIFHKDGKLFQSKAIRNRQSARGIFARRAPLISIAHAFAARNENEISRAALEGVDGDSTRAGDGHGCRACLGIAQAHVCARARRRFYQSHDCGMSSRRRDTG
jgi:Anaerobic dehydrogenases, typically selenocysteine-containing